jgi:hypothetical protein
MRHGFPCQDRVVAALGQLALVKALGFRLKTQGQLRRLPIRPCPIRGAIFAIARACALAIADLRAVHTAAIRGLVSHGGKAADRAGFQRDGWGQYRPDALDGEQLLVRRRVVQTRMDGLCQPFALVPQTVQAPEATGDRQHLGLLREQGREVLLCPCLNPFDAEPCPGIPRHDMLHTEDMGGVLPDHMRAFA